MLFAADEPKRAELRVPRAFGRFAIVGEDAGAVPDAEIMRKLEAAIGAPLIDAWQRI